MAWGVDDETQYRNIGKNTGLLGAAENSNVSPIRPRVPSVSQGSLNVGDTKLGGNPSRNDVDYGRRLSATSKYDLSTTPANAIPYDTSKPSSLRLAPQYPEAAGGQFDIFGGGGKQPTTTQYVPAGSNPKQGKLPLRDYRTVGSVGETPAVWRGNVHNGYQSDMFGMGGSTANPLPEVSGYRPNVLGQGQIPYQKIAATEPPLGATPKPANFRGNIAEGMTGSGYQGVFKSAGDKITRGMSAATEMVKEVPQQSWYKTASNALRSAPDYAEGVIEQPSLTSMVKKGYEAVKSNPVGALKTGVRGLVSPTNAGLLAIPSIADNAVVNYMALNNPQISRDSIKDTLDTVSGGYGVLGLPAQLAKQYILHGNDATEAQKKIKEQQYAEARAKEQAVVQSQIGEAEKKAESQKAIDSRSGLTGMAWKGYEENSSLQPTSESPALRPSMRTPVNPETSQKEIDAWLAGGPPPASLTYDSRSKEPGGLVQPSAENHAQEVIGWLNKPGSLPEGHKVQLLDAEGRVYQTVGSGNIVDTVQNRSLAPTSVGAPIRSQSYMDDNTIVADMDKAGGGLVASVDSPRRTSSSEFTGGNGESPYIRDGNSFSQNYAYQGGQAGGQRGQDFMGNMETLAYKLATDLSAKNANDYDYKSKMKTLEHVVGLIQGVRSGMGAQQVSGELGIRREAVAGQNTLANTGLVNLGAKEREQIAQAREDSRLETDAWNTVAANTQNNAASMERLKKQLAAQEKIALINSAARGDANQHKFDAAARKEQMVAFDHVVGRGKDYKPRRAEAWAMVEESPQIRNNPDVLRDPALMEKLVSAAEDDMDNKSSFWGGDTNHLENIIGEGMR